MSGATKFDLLSDINAVAGDETSEDLRVRLSLMCVMKFDAQAVAHALRTRPLSPLEALSLANLIEGNHPRGFRLKMQGQGKGWKPMADKAAAFRRLMAIGSHVDAQLAEGNTVEDAVIDAASEFSVSEPTVYRDLRLYRQGKAEGII
jgi:hypothetical protein